MTINLEKGKSLMIGKTYLIDLIEGDLQIFFKLMCNISIVISFNIS